MEALKPFTISIVVPSYNQAQFLPATLDSLLAQDDPALEIVVVDGGSTDGSVDIIRRYEKHLAGWTSERDRGQSDALNKGFARVQGEWLGWLNSDDLLQPGALRELRAHIARDPSRQWWIGGGHFIDARERPFRPYRAPHGLTEPAQLHDWSEFWFAQPSTFFRRSLYDAAGASIREDLHYAMDLDLWLRFLKIAAPGFIDAELSVYRHHPSGKTESASVGGEAEIVRVLVEHIGAERAMSRVRRLASERNALRRAWDRWSMLLEPITAAGSKLRSRLARLAARKDPRP